MKLFTIELTFLEDRLMRKKFKYLMTTIVFIGIIGLVNKQVSYKNIVKIGITSNYNAEAYIEYFQLNRICNCEVQFVYLGDDKNTDTDPFKATFENIYTALSNGDVDMVMAIEEDYLFPMQDDDILYNLNENVDLSRLSIDIKNFIESNNNKIYFVPSSLDSVRVLLINNNLMTELGIPIPQKQLEYDEFNSLLMLIDKKIKQSNRKDIYVLSLGSPIDEFLYDDISNFLNPIYPM